MKIELRIGSCFNSIKTLKRKYAENQKVASREYAAAYKRCFEGSSEEVRQKLAAWDYVHSLTREHYMKGGLLKCI